MYGGVSSYGELGELACAPISQHLTEEPTAVVFDPVEEALLIGTQSGWIHGFQCPRLERYWSLAAHAGPLEDMVPMVPGVLSVSSSTVRIHRCGGLPVLTLDMPGADLKACAVRPHQGTHAVLGQGDGGLKVLDVSRGAARNPVASAQLPANLTKLCHRPAGYGLVAAAMATGEIVMLDAQSGLKPVHSPFMAHSGGVVDLDVREHLLISCGMSSSSASVYMPDPHVKVFDVRQIARPLAALPFPAGPNLLRLHPRLYNQALVASASGVIYMAEVPSSGLVSATYRLSAPGAPLLACDISGSGEIVAFACRGLTYLWGTSHSPHVNHGGTPPELPPVHRPPVTPLSSNSSFADAPAYYPMDGRLLSDLPPYLQLSVGKPPRAVDASLAANMKMDDFVGHVANPMFKRGMAAGTAAAAASRLRRRRVQPRSSLQATEQQDRERRRRQRLEQGWELLPEQYSYRDLRSVTQRAKPGSGGSTTSGPSRFIDDVDWSLYNNTCFAGLENDIPNAYCNALLQVLYFIPEVRSAMMVQVPSPTTEFSITDELSLLFRMLACPQQQQPVRASNLLRALKHTREASALGLLEGGNEPRDVLHKDMSLTRRVQSLSLFMLTLLQKEASVAPTDATRTSPRRHRRLPAAAGPSASATPGANGSQAAPNFVESVLGMGVTVRMQSLQTASAPELIRSDIMLQIDLRYPPLPAGGGSGSAEPAAKPNGISDSSAAAESAAQTAASSSTQPTEKASKDGAALPQGRLPFAQVLKNSLVDRKEMRAWFNNSLGYQYVRQQRTPTSLPKVLMVNCLEPSPEMRFHWDPAAAAAADAKGKLGGAAPASGPSKPWLPWFVRISSEPACWEVQVAQADSLEELASEPQLEGEGVTSATYELMAVIAHVKDADDVGDAADGHAQRGPTAGHLVAHIKVGKEYWQDAEAYAAEAGDGMAALSPRSAAESGLLASPMPTPPRPGAPPPHWGSRTEAASGGRTQVKSGILPETLDDSPITSPRQLLPGWAEEAAVPQEEDVAELRLAAPLDEPAATADDTAEAECAAAAGLPDASADAVSSSPAAEEPGSTDTQWVLFNDWSIQTTPAEEARRLYSFQKLPAIAVYARVEDQPSDSSATQPRPPPVPVLTPKSFEQLCRAPPVNPKSTNPRWWKFKPLELSRSEMLGPQCVLGLDAEFVALLPPERAMRDGLQVEVRPMTLGLARISVVRGAGPRAGQCCIDDYIRTVEPVYDYLYQYSGVKPGDLHPNTSSCFLTTLKAAYLKLRFLIDSGCIFVGHGLRQDFRMINIVVARRQVIDTVELFRFKRRRKLSLRFLASYLLGVNIQSSTHDSIEDARTALRLYEAYCRLVKAGELEEKLHEIYEWGTLHGWEPIQRGPSAAATGGLPAPAPV